MWDYLNNLSKNIEKGEMTSNYSEFKQSHEK
jgi:hypothetical protein